ncbi:MAG: glycosyltransferase family 2 protein [Actinomycetota bacterium]
MSPLAFPPVESPLVSAVMVTYGAWEWVRRALRALAENTPPDYELIVVDNASTDGTAERLRESVRGARLIYNERNVGFGPGANRGAMEARGRFLCFLNSDALVQPGWLPPLLEALEHDPRAGAAVPCVINLDRSLQEAGSLLGADGTTVQVGAGEDPDLPLFRFPRYVDYGSAACLLVRRKVFLDVGGFDPAYGQGYCEDVDLCLAMAASGSPTLYEPRATVVHARWGSGNGELAEALTAVNRPILRRRWAKEVARRPPLTELATYPHRLFAGRDAGTSERILVIADGLERHGERGQSRRLSTLLSDLVELWPSARVTLLAASRGLEALPREVEFASAPVGPGGWEKWFEQRLFHYGVTLLYGPRSFERFDGVLERTQPQTLRVFDLPEGREFEGLHLRAVRSSDALFCTREEDLALARALAPEVPAFWLPPPDSGADGGEAEEREEGSDPRQDLFRRELVAAMTHLGIAPPG